MRPPLLLMPENLAQLRALLEEPGVPAHVRAQGLALLWRTGRPTVRWHSPQRGVHVIDGARHDIELGGLDAAHAAVRAAGRRVVLAADFAAPGARRPDNAVRNALGRAVQFLEPVHPGLAAAVATISVQRGCVVFRNSGAIDIEAT